MKKLLLTGAALLPAAAWAHVGDHSLFNLGAGFVHPLTGLDHLLALLAIGVWLAQSETRPKAGFVAAFGVLLAAAMYFGTHYSHVNIETGIAATLVVMGALIAAAIRGSQSLKAGVIVLVALVHGFVHGTELPQGAGVLPFAVAMVISSLVAIVVAMAVARFGNRFFHGLPARVAGAALALAGLLMAF